MKEMLMTNVREKFANARELCPGMLDDVYDLTHYISTIANDQLAPGGILMVLARTMLALESNPGCFSYNTMILRVDLPCILQVLDVIAEPDFADEVRAQCKEVLNWDIPKRVNAPQLSQ